MIKNLSYMKYQKWKIKREHHILKEFESVLWRMESIKQVKRIIPWRIQNSANSSSHTWVNFSYKTHSWLKFKLNNWWSSQECFVICSPEDAQVIVEKVKKM